MRLNRILLYLSCVLSCSLAVGAADDETDDVQIEIKAPIQAINCGSSPATLTVLGQTISVPAGAFDDSDDSDDRRRDDDDDRDDALLCSSLLPGQFVEVKLPTAAAPFTALEVEREESSEIEIQGPLAAIDLSAGTINVLGMTIQVAGARLDGSDDDDNRGPDGSGGDNNDDDDTPLVLTQLTAGQFVEVKLNPAALPALVALEVEVRNFNNQIQLVFSDRDRNIDNDDDLVEVEIQHTVIVRERKDSGRGTRRVKKTLLFRTSGSGSAILAGLPTGTSRVTARRTSDGASVTKNVRVRGNRVNTAVLKLKTPRAQRTTF
ncbi:MAG TPA: DUF5666 domain-containing protein [Planctomycetota bacterium]|nr:DUF5666 domain-containing protein [Planctomycetota bacterium]